MLVLAALDGPDALSGYLDGNQARPRPEEVAAAQQPPYPRAPGRLSRRSITVEGFRGIGQKLSLHLPPGRALRRWSSAAYGSGKSNSAEALEAALSPATTYRPRGSSARVWKLRLAQRCTTRQPRPSRPSSSSRPTYRRPSPRAGRSDADLEAAEYPFPAQSHGKPLHGHGGPGLEAWPSTPTGRLLPYIPVRLHARRGPVEALRRARRPSSASRSSRRRRRPWPDARKSREKAHKEAGQMRDGHKGQNAATWTTKPRLRPSSRRSSRSDWGLGAVESALTQAATGASAEGAGRSARLLANLQTPAPGRRGRRPERAQAQAGSACAPRRRAAPRRSPGTWPPSRPGLGVSTQAHGDGDLPILCCWSRPSTAVARAPGQGGGAPSRCRPRRHASARRRRGRREEGLRTPPPPDAAKTPALASTPSHPSPPRAFSDALAQHIDTTAGLLEAGPSRRCARKPPPSFSADKTAGEADRPRAGRLAAHGRARPRRTRWPSSPSSRRRPARGRRVRPPRAALCSHQEEKAKQI